jgi:hypothetical protein
MDFTATKESLASLCEARDVASFVEAGGVTLLAQDVQTDLIRGLSEEDFENRKSQYVISNNRVS